MEVCKTDVHRYCEKFSNIFPFPVEKQNCHFEPKYLETNFHTREIPQSGSKAKDGEKREKKRKKKLNDGNNNGQATHGARKQAWRTQAAWANNCQTQFLLEDSI